MKGEPLALWGLENITSTCNYIKKLELLGVLPRSAGGVGEAKAGTGEMCLI